MSTGVWKFASALLASLLILPAVSGSAEKKKSAAVIAVEKAAAEALAQQEKALDAWQDTAQWRTVTPEELAMTSEPRAPGASAVHLYTETERNNIHRGELTYWQTKILTDEGRNLANISLRYNKETEKIRRIDARVIQPDGVIVPFTGEIYDRPPGPGDMLSSNVRSFTLPDVRTGSIIEVRYWRTSVAASSSYRSISVMQADGSTVQLRIGGAQGAVPPPRWVLNQSLFTRHAKYALQLLPAQFARWSLPLTLPPGVSEPKMEADRVVRMEARNMPPFVIEDYMPPAEDLVLSVDFSYERPPVGTDGNPAAYWKSFGERHWKSIEQFLGNPKYVSRRLDRIIAKGDSAEQKFRKIYEHVQRMGNIDIPGQVNEADREKCSTGHAHVWDVAEDRCGDIPELQMYFVALCRTAGLPATPVRIASRQLRFFTPESPDASRLDNWLVAVTIDGRELLLSPGAPFLPFGQLVWWDTAVPALKVESAGSKWFTTNMPVPADAVTRRQAVLRLSEDGVIEGTVVVRYTGHEATMRVIGLLQADEQARLDFLKEDLRYHLAVPADISVVRPPDWKTGNATLEIEYRIKVSEWAATSGDRLLVGVGLFGKEQIGKFVAPTREHPIYFRFPFIAEDELEISLPAGYRLQNAPARQVSPDSSLKYVTSVESGAGKISIRRTLTHDLLLANRNQYPRVKQFYELVRSGDQEQVVLAR